MKLTARSQYALLALTYLARQEPDRLVTIEKIATAQGIPPKFLEQLLLAMKRGNFVLSQKGQQGGYRLARRPEEISLADIIRYFDGALSPVPSTSTYFYESGPLEKEPQLTKVFKEIRDMISERMEKTTLKDVM